MQHLQCENAFYQFIEKPQTNSHIRDTIPLLNWRLWPKIQQSWFIVLPQKETQKPNKPWTRWEEDYLTKILVVGDKLLKLSSIDFHLSYAPLSIVLKDNAVNSSAEGMRLVTIFTESTLLHFYLQCLQRTLLCLFQLLLYNILSYFYLTLLHL